jgi:hypothetical protein
MKTADQSRPITLDKLGDHKRIAQVIGHGRNAYVWIGYDDDNTKECLALIDARQMNTLARYWQTARPPKRKGTR